MTYYCYTHIISCHLVKQHLSCAKGIPISPTERCKEYSANLDPCLKFLNTCTHQTQIYVTFSRTPHPWTEIQYTVRTTTAAWLSRGSSDVTSNRLWIWEDGDHCELQGTLVATENRVYTATSFVLRWPFMVPDPSRSWRDSTPSLHEIYTHGRMLLVSY